MTIVGTSEPYKQLEDSFAVFVGSEYAVSVNTGTAALHLALLAVGAMPGTEVIVPDFTMAACAFAVSYTGATPVFVDCDDNLLLNIDEVEKAITEKTVAVMAVHIYGRLCDMRRLRKLCDEKKIALVEDCAEATGAVFESQADVSCYSFYKNKIVHAEEGGMVTTDDLVVANAVQYLKNMAFNEAHDFTHDMIGFNYRMPDSTALAVQKSLKEYYKNVNKRWQLWEKYHRSYKSQLPRPQAPWVYDFLLNDQADFLEWNPTARRFFQPMRSLKPYAGIPGERASYYASRGVYLPLSVVK